MQDRRSVLGALVAGSAAAATIEATDASTAPRRATASPRSSSTPVEAPAETSFLATEPLLNLERARFLMGRENVDALIVTDAANVFYLTNHWPSLDRMGYLHSTFAILPRDPKRPLGIVMQGFLLYYRYADEVSLPERAIYPYSEPATSAPPAGIESEPVAAPIRMHRVLDESLLTPREQKRREVARAAEAPSAGADWALLKACRALGLEGRMLATDDPAIEATLTRRGFAARYRDGEDLLRWTRLEKTPAELQLMRLAAQRNVEAAMETARFAREAGSTRVMRSRFFEAAGRRGNRALFMVINGSSSERFDEPIRDGMAFSIDCVSTLMQYHGDFARTILVGEPRATMRRCTSAIHTAWQEIRSKLRPGMAFADVTKLGRDSMRKQGADFTVGFGPHSVGLFHSDHPSPSLTGGRSLAGLTLLENMVLSVDCPVLDTGIGGTAHLEDLVVIRADGATPLHDVPDNVVIV